VIVLSPIQAVGTRKTAAPVVDDGASRGDVTMPTNASSVARVNGIELGYQVVGEGKPRSESRGPWRECPPKAGTTSTFASFSTARQGKV